MPKPRIAKTPGDCHGCTQRITKGDLTLTLSIYNLGLRRFHYQCGMKRISAPRTGNLRAAKPGTSEHTNPA